MAISAAAAAAIGAGITAGGTIATGFINQGMNKKQFQRASAWNEKMYARQLSDQKQMIADQRVYDSPTDYLKRLREAGLNPNLISGALGGSSSVTSVPGGGSMSAPTGNPMPDIGGSASSGFSQFASGIDTSVLTQMKLLKGQAELEKLELSNEYQSIVNTYADAKESLSLESGQVQLQKNLAEIKQIFSNISVNDNKIKIGNKQIELFDSEMNLNEKNSALAAARTCAVNLDAQKTALMLPYVQAMEEAKYMNLNARTEAAKMAAFQSYTQACINMVLECKEQSLVDSGWAENEIARIKSLTAVNNTNVKYAKKYARANTWNAVGNTIGSVGKVILGAAGLVAAAKSPVGAPSSIILPKSTNFEGQTYNYR